MAVKQNKSIFDFLDNDGLFNGRENNYLVGVIRENGEEDEITVTGSNKQEFLDSYNDVLLDDAHDNQTGPGIMTDRIAYVMREAPENRFNVNLGYGEEAVKIMLGKDVKSCAENHSGIPLELVYADADSPEVGQSCCKLTTPMPGFTSDAYMACVESHGQPNLKTFLDATGFAYKTQDVHQQGGKEYDVYRFDKQILDQLDPKGSKAYAKAVHEVSVKEAGGRERDDVALDKTQEKQDDGYQI